MLISCLSHEEVEGTVVALLQTKDRQNGRWRFNSLEVFKDTGGIFPSAFVTPEKWLFFQMGPADIFSVSLL